MRIHVATCRNSRSLHCRSSSPIPAHARPRVSLGLPFPQYRSRNNLGMIPLGLPYYWRDLQKLTYPDGYTPPRGEGVLLVIQELQHDDNLGLAHPEQLEPCELKEFLLARPFERWLYCPIDGDGPNAQFLPQSITSIIARFDRHLAYCDWAAKLIDRSMTTPPLQPTEHLPHGIDTTIFHPLRDKLAMRRNLVNLLTGQDAIIPEEALLIGIVATSTPRKDIHLALEACMMLRRRGIDLRIWLHTNHLAAYWNLPELLEEFRLDGITAVDVDEAAAQRGDGAVLLGHGRGIKLCCRRGLGFREL